MVKCSKCKSLNTRVIETYFDRTDGILKANYICLNCKKNNDKNK